MKYSLLRSFEVSVPHNVSHREPYQGRYSSIVKVLHHDVTTPHTTSSTISNLITLVKFKFQTILVVGQYDEQPISVLLIHFMRLNDNLL